MSGREARLRIGFIPLCDATALLIAVDKCFTAAEGLDVELVREVSELLLLLGQLEGDAHEISSTCRMLATSSACSLGSPANQASRISPSTASLVARSESVTSNETISYTGTSGYYMWQVYSYSGSGSYNFWTLHP